MLGSKGMINKDQIDDCLCRGWIVAVSNQHLCHQVTLLEGPTQDRRDFLTWIYGGKLSEVMSQSDDTKSFRSIMAELRPSGYHQEAILHCL